MKPEVDYERIGQRIRMARLERRMSQSDLGAIVGCSNNHMSHVETGQTKVSLTMLLRISTALDKDLDYFLLDTPYARRDSLINQDISEKLSRCSTTTLLSVSRIIDVLLDQQ